MDFAAFTEGGVTRGLLSADQHWFAAHHHAAGFVEWQVGCWPRSDPPPPGVVARITGVYNYGGSDHRRHPPAQLHRHDPTAFALHQTVDAGERPATGRPRRRRLS
jgi:hypothetical protein